MSYIEELLEKEQKKTILFKKIRANKLSRTEILKECIAIGVSEQDLINEGLLDRIGDLGNRVMTGATDAMKNDVVKRQTQAISKIESEYNQAINKSYESSSQNYLKLVSEKLKLRDDQKSRNAILQKLEAGPMKSKIGQQSFAPTVQAIKSGDPRLTKLYAFFAKISKTNDPEKGKVIYFARYGTKLSPNNQIQSQIDPEQNAQIKDDFARNKQLYLTQQRELDTILSGKGAPLTTQTPATTTQVDQPPVGQPPETPTETVSDSTTDATKQYKSSRKPRVQGEYINDARNYIQEE